ncbi:MAG: methyltransferase domain-containing protein [Acetobacterium sp.]|nr:methyltransferase domain-containing protein [Acetobacterium sp.]
MRSVPYYTDMHDIISNYIKLHPKEKSIITDIGGATGYGIREINTKIGSYHPTFYYVDNSKDMCTQAQLECCEIDNIHYLCGNLIDIELPNSDIILAVFTLQFIPIPMRKHCLEKIYSALPSGGLFFLSEKICSPYQDIESNFIELHQDIKTKNGFTDEEIIRKKESLIDVMWTLPLDEYISELSIIGFSKIEILFKCLNFSCILCVK